MAIRGSAKKKWCKSVRNWWRCGSVVPCGRIKLCPFHRIIMVNFCPFTIAEFHVEVVSILVVAETSPVRFRVEASYFFSFVSPIHRCFNILSLQGALAESTNRYPHLLTFIYLESCTMSRACMAAQYDSESEIKYAKPGSQPFSLI